MKLACRWLCFGVAAMVVAGCRDASVDTSSPPIVPSAPFPIAVTSAPPSPSNLPPSIALPAPGAVANARAASSVHSDETVVVFPSWASWSEETNRWHTELIGWIYEAEDDSPLRAKVLDKLRDELHIDTQPQASRDRFDERARMFLVDNESRKSITLQLGPELATSAPSGDNGHFKTEATLRLPLGSSPGSVRATALLPHRDKRVFDAPILLVPPAGLTIVSDIDDTIKVTDVRDPVGLLRRTFLEPFVAVDGMAGHYRRWLGEAGHLHFVSSSPWQLYPALSKFVEAAGFPQATFALKPFRLKDSSALSLFDDPLQTKSPEIAALIKRFPQRMFVLVGDSGERDPEVYASLHENHSAQIAHILIRNVSQEPDTAPRYLSVFKDVPREKWTVFEDVKALDRLEFSL